MYFRVRPENGRHTERGYICGVVGRSILAKRTAEDTLGGLCKLKLVFQKAIDLNATTTRKGLQVTMQNRSREFFGWSCHH